MKLLAQPFQMAPMAGVTDAAFRARLRRNGCRRLFTEMISAAALARENRRTIGYLQVPDLGPDLAVQLFGADSAELAEAARKAEEIGFPHANLNMGCPVKKVVRSGAGAALMMDPARARDCVRAMRGAFSGTLSVKVRAGWDAANINCCEMARMVEDCGADLLILHPRTRAQGFSGQADWNLVRDVVASVSIPVVGNGDITSAADAVARLRSSGCAGVMIGRAAMGRPWIFREAEAVAAGGNPSPVGLRWMGDDLLRHVDDIAQFKGPRVALFEMRKFAAWGARGLAGGAEFRRQVQSCEGLEELREAIGTFFGGARDSDVGIREGVA